MTEPFIVPGLYEKWRSNNAGIEVVDEFTLCQAMGDQVAEEMENHYRTFIVSNPAWCAAVLALTPPTDREGYRRNRRCVVVLRWISLFS